MAEIITRNKNSGPDPKFPHNRFIFPGGQNVNFVHYFTGDPDHEHERTVIMPASPDDEQLSVLPFVRAFARQIKLFDYLLPDFFISHSFY